MEDDVFFFRRALSAIGIEAHLHVVNTVSAACAYMEGSGEFKDRCHYPLPDIIVCDHGLGAERGTTFVEWLQTRPDFKDIPVMFFSGSLMPAEKASVGEKFRVPIFTKHSDFEETRAEVATMLAPWETIGKAHVPSHK